MTRPSASSSKIVLDSSSFTQACQASKLYDSTHAPECLEGVDALLEAERVVAATTGAEAGQLVKRVVAPPGVGSEVGGHDHLWAALALMQQGKFVDAANHFEQAMLLGVRHWRLNCYLASALGKSGAAGEAFLALNEARQMAGDQTLVMLVQQELLGAVTDRKKASVASAPLTAVGYQFDSELCEQRLVSRLVKPGMTVFDVGANIGKYTQLFSLLVGKQGRVFAFEPSPGSVRRLKARIVEAGLKNVVTVSQAICDRSGHVTLNQFPEEYATWNSLGRPQMEDPKDPTRLVPLADSVEVECGTLDDFCRAEGISRIDYLKLDVEGVEFLALQGSKDLLARKAIGYLQFEVSKKMLEGMNTCARPVFDFLAAHGYECHAITTEGGIGDCVADSDAFYQNYIAFPSVPAPGGTRYRSYEEVRCRVEAVPGLLCAGQEEFLFNKVCSLPDDAVIVEIGSFKGRSTVAMGLACVHTKRRLICIDTWAVENWEGKLENYPDGGTLAIWQHSVSSNALEGYVTSVRSYSHEALARWPDLAGGKPIDFIFIDGSHEYAAVLRDFEMALPLVKPGGWVAFHDVIETWPGLLRVWREHASPVLELHESSSSLACGQKPLAVTEKSFQPVVGPLDQGLNARFSFVTIVLNGMPFIEHALRAVYDFAHEIIIVEGAVENCRFAAKPDGSSVDGTVECIRRFPDPLKKIRLIQGQWPEKCEMQNAALAHVAGDYVWLMDSDEIYRREDLDKVADMVRRDPSITQFNLIPDNFWKGFDHLMVAPYFFQTEAHFRRIFKFVPGATFSTHRPPTLVWPGETRTTEQMNCISGETTRAMGIISFHYSYVVESQVAQKIELYNRYGWGKDWQIDMNAWFHECWQAWTPTNRDQIESRWPVWTGGKGSHTVPFTRAHPDVMKDYIAAFRRGIAVSPKATASASEDRLHEVIGSRTYLEKALAGWTHIQQDAPLKRRIGMIREAIASGRSFWNNHVALAFLADRLKPSTYLEIGVRTGASMVQVLTHAPIEIAGGVDLWSGEYADMPNTKEFAADQLTGHRKASGGQYELHLLQGDSHTVLKDLLREGCAFDLINVDGDHTDAGALEDLEDALKLLTPRGAILFDDIIHPAHRSLMNVIRAFATRHPELTLLLNSRDDNGVAILLRGISVGELLPELEIVATSATPTTTFAPKVKKSLKVAEDYAHDKDLTQIDGDSEFARAIRDLFKNHQPRRIIETGTYLGTGTTRVIAETLRDLGITDAVFHSIEINPDHFAQAGNNLRAAGLESFVNLHRGLSVPRRMLPTMSQIEESTIRQPEYEDIFVDHREAQRAKLYFAETNFSDCPDDLLGCALRAFGDQPDFVLLDSGGHMGFVEFQYLVQRLVAPCLIALDDIHHIKHHKSFQFLRGDPRFELLVESKEKFGFCLARFTPAIIEPDNSVKRLLWVRTDSIGDAVLASSILPWIQEKYPEAKITVLCQQHVADLYLAAPMISSVICVDRKRTEDEAYLKEIIGEIAEFDPQLVLNSTRSRDYLSELLTLAFRNARHICIEGDSDNISAADRAEADSQYDLIIPSPESNRTELSRHADFVRGIGIQADNLQPLVWTTADDEALADAFFQREGLNTTQTIGLFPGAQFDLRVYPGYSSALEEFKDFRFLIFGDKSQSELADDLASRLGERALNLCGRTTLPETAAILRRCRLYIGAESAGAHIACAVGVPNVVLLGGGHFGRFMPYSPLTSAVALPLDCFGCNWGCAHSQPHCIKDVLPGVLAEAVRQTLAKTSSKPRVFLQSVTSWKGGRNLPAWQRPDEFLNGVDAEIIQVNSVIESNTLTPEAQQVDPVPLASVEPSPALSAAARGCVQQAERFLQAGEPAREREWLERALDLAPDHLDLMEALCETDCRLGNLDSARQTYQAIVKRDPQRKSSGLEIIQAALGLRSEDKTPLVSVLVSTYVSEKYLRACLADLQAQTIADKIEIIVIDSGSPQNERAIVEEFQKRYSNIRYLRTERETIYAAWNRGVELARGKYITNANSDDSHRADALEVLVAALDAHPEASLAYGDYANSSAPNDSFTEPHVTRRVVQPDFHPAEAMFYCPIGCHPMWRRTVFEQIGLFDPSFTAPGDYEFLLRFIQAGLRAVHVPECLSLFFQNPQGLSWKSGQKSKHEWAVIQAKYRAEMPIERLFRVAPADARSKALGWVAFGNLAMNFKVPWFENSSQDLDLAITCYEAALKCDPENTASLCNLTVARMLKGNVAEGESLMRRLPPEQFQKIVADIKRGRLELVEVDVAPAAEPLTYSPAGSRGRVEAESGSDTAGGSSMPVNPAPERSPRMPVRWVAPFHAPGDYSSDASDLVMSLNGLVDLATLDQTEVYSDRFAAGLPASLKTALETTGEKFNFVLDGISISERGAVQFTRPRGTKFNIGRTTIASDRLPANWARICNQMDEIWVPSRCTLDAFAVSGVERDKLVVVPASVDAAAFQTGVVPMPLPGRAAWNFLSVCEWNEQSGWEVLLAAYLREFSAADDVCLHFLAQLPCETATESKSKIQEAIQIHMAALHLGSKPLPRIEVLDIARADLPRLYRAVDCVVIPARGEGWGRVALEAMWMGQPVIATDYGAHTDFATEDNSYPLARELVEIRTTEPELLPLRGLRWANPSEAHLRELLRRVQQNPAEAKAKGARARASVETIYGREQIANQVALRLAAIEQKLTIPSCPPITARATSVAPEILDHKPQDVSVAWEGSFLDAGSLSHVNRELTRQLASLPHVQLSCVSGQTPAPARNGVSPWPETARQLKACAPKQTQVSVRHEWPPNWKRPAAGLWVLIQPWEFGVLPLDWCKQLARVDEVWVPSDYVRRVYVDSGVELFKVKVVPNGIDPERFQPSALPLKLATNKSFKFLFVGGTIHRKGPDLLLKTFLECFTAADDVSLVIKDFGGQSVYSGQTFEAQIKAAQSQPNAPEILYLNEELSPEALPGLYTACDCLVHPYRGEGFGLPVLEAIACGLPVIVTGGGSTDDFATDEFAYRLPALRKEFCDSICGMKLIKPGWLLEPDANAFADRLKWIVTHRAEASAKGKAASDHVRREWTWAKAAQIADQHLQRLVTSREAASITPPRRAQKALTLPPVARFGNLAAAREMLSQNQILAAWNKTVSALSVRPYHPEAFLLLAEIARAAGDSERSKNLAEHARKLAPKWKAVQQFLKSPASKPATKIELPPLAESRITHHASRLTVCLITKNEERFLGACLESIRDLAQQIIAMDTGSTDRTVEIARQHGAEVYSFAWCDDFSAARNAALERATGDWVLVLDADEELLPDQREKLRKLMQDSSAMAFRLPMIDEGREEEGVSYLPRLFRNAPGLFFMGCVHEHVFLSVEARRQEWGLANKLGDATLLHHGYTAELMQSRGKSARNLKLLQKALAETPDDPNLLMNLGLELARAGRLPDGIEQYDAAFRALSALPAAEVVPEFCEALLTQFCTHLVSGKDYGRVARVLRSPLARAGGLTATLHWLFGLACIESKNFADGAEQMRQCLAKRRKPALSSVNKGILKGGPSHCLALCLVAMKQRDAAGKAFRAALLDEPTARPVRLDYARFLAEGGQEIEALNLLHQLMTEDGSDVRVWQLGGQVALSRPEFLKFACDWTSEAMKAHADQPAIVEQRATALLLNGNPEEALPLWKRLDSEANPSGRAAIIICRTVLDQPPDDRTSGQTGPVNQEFVSWYRRLIGVNALQVIEALNQRMEPLRRFVPEAIRQLEAAFADTDVGLVK